MNASLIERIKNLPTTSGVYQYYDKHNKLLYIGKAKNLKNRIKSYFRIENDKIFPNPSNGHRIQMMVSQIAYLQTLLVQNEQDALILENSLIKQLKPKYNILLRDDKTYPYIYIDMSEEFPTPSITRKIIKNKNVKYFGPYTSGSREILDSLYEILPLVQKRACLNGKKACLFYQIKRCPAPCEGKISASEYHQIITQAINLIQNKNKLLGELESKMISLSDKMRFEEAMIYRDRIKKLQSIENFSNIDLAKLYNLDIFALSYEGKNAILSKLFMRDGKIVSSNFEHIKSEYAFDENSIYQQAIINHYKEEIPLPPDQILIPSISSQEDINELEEFLQNHCKRKIQILIPQKGDKKNLIELAFKNANEILRLQSSRSYLEDTLLLELKELLNLNEIPFVIEVFDTSHHSGSHIVGGMVVYENMNFIKDSYRRYILEGKDEYSQIKEMLIRRAKDFSKKAPPNLWIIDGGKAQINLARDILQSVGVDIDIIGIAKEKIDSKAHRAKGSAKDTIYTLERTFHLKPSDKRLQFLQKLRDEVHRYAITFHRQQKQKDMHKISLLEKKGIGKTSVKKLLDFFGSFEAIENATPDEIKEVLSKKLKY
ncbi:excinuclease ABC subunit C [Helicobacter sp. 13S00482-2]|uniref:excinuclease ABC subunit UvrC n=1 Tax=Helicobacter sp. 13S00482-2 TaxID=1476200 RepID=UPI000BD0BD27|nr:excinuclease ABC subunit UvrC [Helicobacter sp. 13S00482-2]PAF54186.1 excinuclease ABC subunit C [Helicobacter sp. 13S00482-2]